MSAHDLVGPLAIIHVGIDPILFHIGRFAVHWYGVMYAVAFLVAFRYGVLPHVRSRGLPQATVEAITAWTILFGLLGARLYYVIQQPDLKDFLTHPIRIIAVWEGGMAFFGAIIAGLLTIWVLARRHRLSFWLLADAGVLFASVGQPIGRIGNIINGDILGAQSDLPWATAYTFHSNPGQCAVLQPNFFCGIGYQPAGLYEALGTLVILGILLLLRRRGVRDGVLAITYVGAYAVSQLLLFQFRKSEPAVLGSLKQAQVTALAILLLGVPGLYMLWKRTPEPATPSAPPRAPTAGKPERKSVGRKLETPAAAGASADAGADTKKPRPTRSGTPPPVVIRPPKKPS